MADSPFRVTDSFTGERMEFKNYDAYLAYMDKKESSASKTTKKPAKRESIQKMKTPAEKINEKIIKQSSVAETKSKMESVAPTTLEYRESGDSPSSFSRKDFKIGAEGSGKSLDQAAKEFADKEAYSPTGIWEFDLGYAAGRARKKKIEAAGGKEAFKAAKQEKRSARRMKRDQAFMSGVGKLQSAFGVGTYGKDKKQQRTESRAIAKERKNFQPIDKMPTTKLKSSSGRSSILASGLRNASEYHSPSPSKAKTKNTTKNQFGKEANFYKKMLNSSDFKSGRTIYTDKKSVNAARKRGDIY